MLGDDVIIGHEPTALEYLSVMDELGVGINFSKSLVSPKRLVGEFAKRFFTPKDSSMIPLKEIIVGTYNFAATLELVRKYNLSVKQILGILGYGYRVKGGLNKPYSSFGNKASGILVALSHPLGPKPMSLTG